ncbi:hypothetical protein [Streptosporangium sp. NPDC049304]|uniref:hypothetical protein n=1 Tax=Streptosporangium sp. NPDC049304 TaxID=3154830 RepID=UPI00342AA0BA
MMLDTDTILTRRYANARPGLQLIAIEDAALPVTLVGVEVLAQERKPFPLLDEFVLRMIDTGVVESRKMAQMLGLDIRLIESTVVDQMSADNISKVPGSARFALTSRGKNTTVDLVSIRPVQQQLSISFDRLVWGPAAYPKEYLLRKSDAEAEGRTLLPAARSQQLKALDVTAQSLNALISEASNSDRKVEILAVQKVRPKTHRYLPVKLLVYADSTRGELQLGVVVDDTISQNHELALERAGGAQALGFSIGQPADRPILDEDLEEMRIPLEQVTQLRSQLKAPEEANELPMDVLEEVSELGRSLVRSVSMPEHRELLKEALATTNRRLLIISPWIKGAVVNTQFLASLERLLRRGVSIHIGHGYGNDDSGSDTRVLERLGNLAARFPERFVFTRLKNTHAKILIFDGTWISTSFNWLSFQGSPDRTYRMEEGTLVRIPETVDQQYAQYVEVITEQS